MGGQTGAVFFATLLMCSMLAGCFGNDDSEQEKLINLVVHYDATNGTIEQSYLGGSQISFTGVTFSFDFARTTSDYGLETFSLEPGDGRSAITIDASESANIDVEYQIHGMYTIVLAQQTSTETQRIKPLLFESNIPSIGVKQIQAILIRWKSIQHQGTKPQIQDK